MLVSWKWLNELVDIKVSPEELAGKMTMAGIQAEGIKRFAENCEGIVAGIILEIYKHPQADRLLVCTVETGEKETLNVITGATNVRVGQKVPVALPGAVLNDGKQIRRVAMRGIESEAMLCSAGELGLNTGKLSGEQKEGIFILPQDIPAGTKMKDALELDDLLIEFSITPNRADCLAMFYLAREAAALTGGGLKLPKVNPPIQKLAPEQLEIEITASHLCKRFIACIIKEVKITASPAWLQMRLLKAGIRPINNVVDITNYVMLETGQPLHAFDYDRVQTKKIEVRTAQEGECMITLDGKMRKPTPEALLVTDGRTPLSLAGVMGGQDSEISGKTGTVLLEAACFDPVSIRRTSKEMEIRSDAVQRFEKGIEPERAWLALRRAVQLMACLDAGVSVEGYTECYPFPEENKPVMLRLDRTNQLLGTSLDSEAVEGSLQLLDMEIVESVKKGWLVSVPAYRRDLRNEVDLIEEVARLYGYDNISATLPSGKTTPGARTNEQRLRERIAELLVAQGMHEIVSYSFINRRHPDLLHLPEDHPYRNAIEIANPLSEEQSIMRTTIIPGHLLVTKRNLDHGLKNLKIFELAKVYFPAGFPGEKILPEERWVLGSAMTGKREKNWRHIEGDYDFFHMKGVVENLLSELNIRNWEFVPSPAFAWLHSGKAAAVRVSGKEIGYLGEIHPLVLKNYEIDQPVTVLNIDLELLFGFIDSRVIHKGYTRYPAVTRDLAVVVPQAVTNEAVEKIIRSVGKGLLKEMKVFDVYQGAQIPKGCKSLAYSLYWQAEDRTLEDEEINVLHNKIEKSIQERLAGEIRRG